MSSNLKSYVSIDIGRNGLTSSDRFNAPHDTAAARRAQFAAEGEVLQLWNDARLVGSWRRTGRRSFERDAI